MPGETISEITEQQVSTVEKGSPEQSKPDLPDSVLPDDIPNESTSSTSTNELANGLKRPLPDGVDSVKNKKPRLEDDLSEDELEVTIKNDGSGKNHTELLIEKISESLKITIDNEESNVSNKIHHNLTNGTNSSSNIINHNGNNGIDDKDCEKDYPDKNTLSEDISKDRENKTSNINNVNNSCEFIRNSKNRVKNGKNKLAKNDIFTSKGLNKSLSSDQEKKNVAVVDDIQETENILSTAVDNYLEYKKKYSDNNTDDTKTIESRSCNSNSNNNKEANVGSNGIDQDIEVIDTDTNSNVLQSDLPEDMKTILLNGVKQMSKESFPQMLKLFSEKDVTYDQFESLCTQKMIAMMTEKLYWGKTRSDLQSLMEREKHWRAKYSLLNRQFKEIKTIVSVHKQELKTNELARPHVVTRTVGLQALLCSNKDGCMRLPKLAIPLTRPIKKPVSITVDDEDDEDVVELEIIRSASSSNTTPKKQIPSLVTTSKSPKNVTASPKAVIASPKAVIASPKTVIASPKTVTATKSLNPNNIVTTATTTIDLTGNDDLIEEGTINLEDAIHPVKIVRRPPAILPKPNGNLSNAFTYVELPNNLPSTSSSFIMRSAPGSPQRTIVSNKDTINTSPKSKTLKPILIDVSRVDPVILQPCTVTYTGQRVPVSQISGPLQTIPMASITPRQLPMSQLSASLKTLKPIHTTCQVPISRSPVTLPQVSTFTACRLPISLHTIHQTLSQSIRKPPPAAIPISGHPSPIPGLPNQKSLPAWKRLPPAPKVAISKKHESPSNPQALVLLWTMELNKTIAEIIKYQIYAYQETPDEPPNIELWKKIGKVDALPLPMACSLNHFSNGQKYHFLVRAVDVYGRVGPFSLPESIT